MKNQEKKILALQNKVAKQTEKLKNEISNLKKNYSKSDNSQTPHSNNDPSTRDKDNR